MLEWIFHGGLGGADVIIGRSRINGMTVRESQGVFGVEIPQGQEEFACIRERLKMQYSVFGVSSLELTGVDFKDGR